jgi:hypothetical protein
MYPIQAGFRKGLRAFAYAAFICLVASVCQAATFTVAWDANTEGDLAGYRVLVGTSPGRYTQTYDVGLATSKSLDLPDGTTYYIAVVAYNSEGLVSTPSNEVTWFVPAPLPPSQFTTTVGSDQRLSARLLQWRTVADAEMYYLYVGTGPGLSNVVNTGETSATSQALPFLADGVYYARVYTRQRGIWRASTDLVFRPPAAHPAELITPAMGARDVTSPATIQWSTALDAEKYYLYVGTASGLADVVNTGEISSTSISAMLPAGKVLYARVYTEFQGVWVSSKEVQFATADHAHFIYPVVGSTDVPGSETFQWTPVTGAAAYYLYVGSAPGLNDIVNTGEIQNTSFDVTGLPAGKQLFARIYTHINDAWRYDEVPFRTATISRLTSPTPGTNASLSGAFKWTPITGAAAYYLYVGTSSGAKDIVDTGEVHTLSAPLVPLPADQQLWARIWTDTDGTWHPSEISFTLRGATLSAPVDTASASGTTFQWNTISNADAYYLYVGTAPGAKDIVDTGEITTTSYRANSLPTGTIYVTLWTKVGGTWRSSTAVLRSM